MWRTLLIGCLVLLLSGRGAQAAGVAAQVEKDGEAYRVEAVILAAVSPSLAWEVLTDFDHMERFVPNVEHSEVIARDGLVLTLRQRGAVRFGPVSRRFESQRRIELQPPGTLISRQISGSLRQMESSTTIAPAAGGTRIVYRALLEPPVRLPALVGATLVRHEVEEQFDAIVAEMLRRQADAPPEPPRAR